MNHEKKTGRRFRDFSHLFISSQSEKSSSAENSQPTSTIQINLSSLNKPVYCVTSFNSLEKRISFILQVASELAEIGKRVLLIDADFNLPRISMKGIISKVISVLDLLSNTYNYSIPIAVTEKINLFTIDADISDLNLLEMKKRILLKGFFRTYEEESDIILISLPANLNIKMIINLVQAANRFVIVTPKEKQNLMKAYSLIKSVGLINENIEFGVIIENSESEDEVRKAIEILKRVSSKFLGKTIDNFGTLSSYMHNHELSENTKGNSNSTFSYENSLFTEVVLELLKNIEKRKLNRRTIQTFTEKLIN